MTGASDSSAFGDASAGPERGDGQAAWDLERFEERLRAGQSERLDVGLDPDALRAVQVMQQIFHGAEPPLAPLSPKRIGRFEVLELLGTGRFGVVWRAFDPKSRRQVAVKVLQPGLVFDEDQRRRFQRECQLAAKLDHHGIVPVYETGSIGELLYLVMPVCQGLTLDRWQAAQSAAVPAKSAVRIAQQLAEAVHFGHLHGVVHRDLKPGNVIVAAGFAVGVGDDADRRPPSAVDAPIRDVRILDFGLAIPMEVSLRDTRGSIMAGTPLYMAPEQAACRLEDIGPATDVFAIGAILYELLTGQPPFNASSLPEVLERLENETPASICRQRPDVTGDLDAVCLKCLAYDPGDRYVEALELAHDLDRVLNDRPVSAHSPGRPQRIVRWSGQRRGRQILSMSGIAVNVVMLIWAVSALPVSLWQARSGGEAILILPFALPLVFGIMPLHLTLIWLARQIERRTFTRAYGWIGLVLSLATLAYAIAVLLGAPPPSPAYSQNPFAIASSFTLVAVSAVLTSAVFLLATLAVRPGRRQASVGQLKS